MNYLNENTGIVMSNNSDGMIIELRRGGQIQAPHEEGIELGDEVAFLTDVLEKKVIRVMLKSIADELVERGSNHLFDVAERDPHQEIEEEYDGDTNRTNWDDDKSVFRCPELDQ